MTDQQRYSDPAEIRHTIGATGTLSIHNISGDIALTGADTDEVVVEVHSAHGRSEPLPIVVRRTEGGLHIETDKRSLNLLGSFFRTNDDLIFEARVPRAARVEIQTVSADIDARSLAGEQSYKTVSGDLNVAADGGRIEATTVSGDIKLRATEDVDVSVSTTSGDITVAGAILRTFEAKTVSGDVALHAGLAAGPRHSVETVSGDFELTATNGVTVDVKRSMDVGRRDERPYVCGDGAAQLRYRTLSGDVDIRGADALPSKPASTTNTQLDVLRALERGEIDIDEATRRLQETSNA